MELFEAEVLLRVCFFPGKCKAIWYNVVRPRLLILRGLKTLVLNIGVVIRP